MERFKQPVHIIKTLKNHGFEAYFVGGSVRDYLIGRVIGDIDIATSALPEDVMRIFPRHVPVGVEHGTVVVLEQGVPYEVTTFRMEEDYKDFRRPSSVTFIRSLEEDLKRRDFTMNAIAMDETGKIIDPFGGQAAIKNKIIQTVGDPNERFQEDALRMMRGIRFVSTLGFVLAEETKKAIEQNADLLEQISIERVAMECEKMLTGTFASQAFQHLVDTKLYKYLPYLENKERELRKFSSYALQELQNSVEAWVCLLYITNLHASEVLKAWKLSNKKIKSIDQALQTVRVLDTEAWNNLLLYKAGKETVMIAERVRSVLFQEGNEDGVQIITEHYNQLPIHSRQELQVTGRDLLEWTEKKAGPWVADVLERIEAEVVNNRLQNSKLQIREWLNRCNLL
ncbi:CCA tRNA nucleotidyltransferase [Bacillus sp. 165]|uniref:CCA tRNA nucleotidyltransferase n=1 Tax=Bacillus sp. 165 TaxID=1529117 RepID=UPI001ADD020A|nr:CCA tRNA nucleotidyltransferase [Bacillus sp. 165]MBO9128221.1 CCA tRNA nucleotidyltransferase [Bacillus sp. 165]